MLNGVLSRICTVVYGASDCTTSTPCYLTSYLLIILHVL